MPEMNELLLKAINRSDLSKEVDVSKALDELITVDSNDPIKFREAVTKHRAFWEKMGISPEGINGNWADAKPIGMVVGGTDPADYLEDDTFLNHASVDFSFEKIKQAATEQRVKLDLAAVTDQDVLLKILKYNSDECRAYLMGKAALPHIPMPFGWTDNELTEVGKPSQNKSTGILTNEAVTRIKQQTAQQLLLKLITDLDPKDLDKLDTLIKSRTEDVPAFQDAAKEIGFPQDAVSLSSLNSLEILTPDLMTKARQRSDDLKKTALDEFNKIVRALNVDWLAGNKALLENASPEVFLKALLTDPQFAAVQPKFKVDNEAEFAEKLQKQLCERYLLDKLTKTQVKPNALAGILNANSYSSLKTELKAALPAHDVIIDKSVKSDNMDSLKVSMLKGFLSNLPFNEANLKYFQMLESTDSKEVAKKLSEGLKSLAKKDIPLDFVKPEHVQGIQEIIRDKVQKFTKEHLEKLREKRLKDFEGLIDKTHLGHLKQAHPALRALFPQLPDKKQAELLKEGNGHKVNLIMRATTPEKIKALLGTVDATGQPLNVAAVETENKKNAAFREVKSPRIATTLIGLGVSDDKIAAVNTALSNHKDLDFSNPDHYKTLIDALWNASSPPADQQENFYRKFGLQGAASPALLTPTPDPDIARMIKEHHIKSKALYDQQKPNDLKAKKTLEDLFLRVGIPDSWDENDVRGAWTKFADSKDVHVFLDELLPDSNDKYLKQALKMELTPTVFRKIQFEKREQLFTQGNEADQQKMINEVNAELTELQKNKPSIKQHEELLAKLPTVEVLRSQFTNFYDGTLSPRGAEKVNRIKKTYEETLKECNVVLAHLERNLADVNACLDSARPAASINDPKISQQFDEMREKLELEREALEEQIVSYKATQEKIAGKDGLLANFNEFAASAKRLQHKSLEATYTSLKRSELKGSNIKENPEARKLKNTTISGSRDLEFATADVPDMDHVLCVDMVHYKVNQQKTEKTAVDRGRFIIDFYPEDADRSERLVRRNSEYLGPLWTHDELQKRHPLRTEVISVPKDPNYHAKQSIEQAMNLLQHWDGETPIVLEGVKGKEDELKFLYYAFLELGEHHPLFKPKTIILGPDNKAEWNPGKDKTLLGYYKSDSVREAVFKGSAKSHISTQIEDFKSLIANRMGPELDTAAKASATKFRETLQEGRAHDIQKKVERDAAVEQGNTDTSSHDLS